MDNIVETKFDSFNDFKQEYDKNAQKYLNNIKSFIKNDDLSIEIFKCLFTNSDLTETQKKDFLYKSGENKVLLLVQFVFEQLGSKKEDIIHLFQWLIYEEDYYCKEIYDFLLGVDLWENTQELLETAIEAQNVNVLKILFEQFCTDDMKFDQLFIKAIKLPNYRILKQIFKNVPSKYCSKQHEFLEGIFFKLIANYSASDDEDKIFSLFENYTSIKRENYMFFHH